MRVPAVYPHLSLKNLSKQTHKFRREKGEVKTNILKEKALRNCCLIEGVFEAIPQAVLQSYILVCEVRPQTLIAYVLGTCML